MKKKCQESGPIYKNDMIGMQNKELARKELVRGKMEMTFPKTAFTSFFIRFSLFVK